MTRTLMALAAGVAAVATSASTAPAAETPVKNIVLVHGAWADGSGWQGVYKILSDRGYHVSIVQNPLTTFAEDVAATDRVLARQDGPVILVGHSYGGAVISEAGDDDKVVGLVYIAAFMPDAGESPFGLLPQDQPPPFEQSADGYAFLAKAAYLGGFAPDVDPDLAAFMEASQVPIAFAAGTVPLTTAAWRSKPSWYLLSQDDHLIAPDLQRSMSARAGSTVVEVPGSHVVFISNPEAAADLIEAAAKGVDAAIQ